MECQSSCTEQEVLAFLKKLKEIVPEEKNGTRYDPYYQTIDLPFGHKIAAYGDNERLQNATWEAIKDLVNWSDKCVVDIGCLNGFFCCKIKEAGASHVLGLDLFPQAVDVAAEISRLKGLEIQYQQCDIGEGAIDKNCDIVLLLNMLHHVKNPEHALVQAFSMGANVIMEVQFAGFNSSQGTGFNRMAKNMNGISANLVTAMGKAHGHSLVAENKSARPNRTILHYRRDA